MHGLQAPRGARSLRTYRTLLLSGALVLLTDQITKQIALETLGAARGGAVLWEGVLRLRLTFNPGGAFGLGQDFPLFFLGATVVVSLLILVWARKVEDRRLLLPLGLILGGGLGNLVDRLFRGFGGRVVDFVDLQLIDWPVFNVADMAIVTGVGAIFVMSVAPRHKTSGDPG